MNTDRASISSLFSDVVALGSTPTEKEQSLSVRTKELMSIYLSYYKMQHTKAKGLFG